MRGVRLAAGLLSLSAACVPAPGPSPSIITAPRVLAVRSDPAEALPGTEVGYQVLVAGPQGTPSLPAVSWAYCLAPKPLTENNVVSPDCLQDANIAPVAATPQPASARATIPSEACRLFGPDAPPEVPGQPPLRPRDPDVTGGYYQPLRVILDNDGVTFGLQRILCNLAGASAEIAQDFRARYRENHNPELLGVTLSVAGQPLLGGGVGAAARVHLQAQLRAGTAETFPLFDPGTRALIDRRESLRISWFATAGTFDHERTGQGETEDSPTSDNEWEAPTTPGPVYFWVVLRDSRGGVDYAALSVNVAAP